MILANVDLAATTQTLLFSVDKLRSIDDIIFTNRTGGAVLIRAWAVPIDVVVANKHAIAWDTSVPANSTVFIFSRSYLFRLGEQFYVQSDTSSVNVSLIGT